MANLKTIQKPNSKLTMIIMAGILGTIVFDAAIGLVIQRGLTKER